jgi:hypothetical protein
VSGVDVGVAKPGRLDAHADLTGLERALFDLLDGQRVVETVHDGCLVGGAGRCIQ